MGLEFNSLMEVDRTQPHAELDGTDIDARLTRYREQAVVNFIQTKHPLADEGSYYNINNAQTGLATAAAVTAFSATNPFLTIYNNSSPSDDFAKKIYFDYLTLVTSAPGTAGTNLQFAIVADRGNRYLSGGTTLLPVGINQSVSLNSGARINAGNLTASTPTTGARTLVGNRFMKGAIPVIGDQYQVRFGTSDLADQIATATITFSTNNTGPIMIGPDETLLVYLWLPSQSAASSYIPEMGYWER